MVNITKKFNVVGSNLTLFEVNSAAEVIRQVVHPEANVIFGVVLDPNMGNEVQLTLIATGFATKEALAGTAKDKEISQLLRGLKAEEELDIPSFLRRDVLLRQWSHPASLVRN